jgi:hypothetical protein
MGGECASTQPETVTRLRGGDSAPHKQDLEDGMARGQLRVPATSSLLISLKTSPLFCLASPARELPK